jgi:hypothetical protein
MASTRLTHYSTLLTKDSACLRFVSMGDQPDSGFLMLIGERWTGGDHHPESRFSIGGRILRPLPLSDQELSETVRNSLA